MKTGIFYYSRTGNTWQVADILRKELKKAEQECMLIELKPGKERAMPLNIFRAIRGKPEPIVDFPDDVSGFDQIIIGTPIWAGNPVPVINTFFSKVTNLDKVDRIVLYCTYSLRGDKRVLKKMRSSLPQMSYSLLLTKSFCTRKGRNFQEETKAFARDLINF